MKIYGTHYSLFIDIVLVAMHAVCKVTPPRVMTDDRLTRHVITDIDIMSPVPASSIQTQF